MNEGMISGCVVRVENKSRGPQNPACIVTIAGETERSGGKTLVYFEQVRITGSAALDALALQPGEAVLFDRAAVEQMIWTDPVTHDPRSQIVVRGRGFVRLQGARTKRVGEHLVLEGAINVFTIKGRLAKNSDTRKAGVFGEVTEAIVTVNLPNRQSAQGTRPHHLKVEAWRNSPLKGTSKGQAVLAQVLIKTDTNIIQGEKRYFTVLEERQSSVLA